MSDQPESILLESKALAFATVHAEKSPDDHIASVAVVPLNGEEAVVTRKVRGDFRTTNPPNLTLSQELWSYYRMHPPFGMLADK